MVDLTGRHVVIIGGSRGIGAATAMLADELGAKISVVFHSNRDAADAVVEKARRGIAIQADIAVEDDVKRTIKEAVVHNGPIDGLVISAGVFEGAPIGEMTVEFWDRTMNTNVRGTFLSVKHALPHLSQGASIVIYTSTAGQRGSAVYSAYATSKGAQIMFMRSMALELAPKVRVNCIAPAWTETDMADASLTALGRESVAEKFPMKRIGLPKDVAQATCFLLSDAASFVTGMTMTVDGGMDMRG